MNDILIEKIRKLLALSEGGGTVEESALALEKARELALKADLDIAAIKPFEQIKKEREEVKRNIFEAGKRFSLVQDYVNGILRNHFNVESIYVGNRSMGRSVHFIGTATNLQMAAYVQEFLSHEFMRLWQVYYKKTGVDLACRKNYLAGLYNGLNNKLEAQKVKFEAEIDATVKNNYALMVVNDAERVKDKMAEFFPKLTHVKRNRNIFADDAYHQGIETGKNINISKPIGSSTKGELV